MPVAVTVRYVHLPLVEVVPVHSAYATVVLAATPTVLDEVYDASPENTAVIELLPNVPGVHRHDAVPLDTATAVQFEMSAPAAVNFTVPVVVAGPVTVAVNVYVLPMRGEEGSDPSVMDEVAHVVAVDWTLGRLVAPESTGVTRTS